MIYNIDPWDLWYEEQEKKHECINCKRDMPNKEFKTKNGCRWCDKEIHNGKK